jgi:hypothetical protein
MYYFAYGSNIDTNHFIKFISAHHIKVIGPAYINNHIFKYRKIKNSKLRSGVANIEERLYSKTYGIIYFIKDDTDIERLDKKEGYINECNENNKYNKIIIQATVLNNNKKINCFAYQINEKFKDYQLKPRIEYINFLKNGNKMHNLGKLHFNRINYIVT